MKHHKRSIAFVLLILANSYLGGLTGNSNNMHFPSNDRPFTDTVLNKQIKTALLHKTGNEESYPVINLHKNEQLQLSFDDLDADIKNYYYTFVHCNSDWFPSGLQNFMFLEGYETGLIENITESFRTKVPYTHYEVNFPNQYVKITRSGNYIVKVFLDSGQGLQDILIMRFMVAGQQIKIEHDVKKGFPESDDGEYTQKVELSLITQNMQMVNNYENIEIVVYQNRRTDNRLVLKTPTSVTPNEIIYSPISGNTFESGNEFRNFDIKDLKHVTEYLSGYEHNDTATIAYLQPVMPKTFNRYITRDDLNGRFLIRNEPGRNNPETESEYVWVRFSMPYKNPVVFGDLYLIGQFTGWQLTEDGKLEYDYNKNAYIKYLYLKQGFYEYHVLYKDHQANFASTSLIEGNHFGAENEYLVCVYYQAPGTTFQYLIGTSIFSSR